MSNVTLSIGGRTYTVACAEGEESHILRLGAMIDGKLATMGDMTGQSENRALLFAALLLADDLYEAKAAVPASQDDPADAARLDRLADRLENLAARLEG